MFYDEIYISFAMLGTISQYDYIHEKNAFYIAAEFRNCLGFETYLLHTYAIVPARAAFERNSCNH